MASPQYSGSSRPRSALGITVQRFTAAHDIRVPRVGSAAAAFAGVVHRFDEPTDGTHRRIIEQGDEIGWPSEVVLEAGKFDAARFGGHAVRVGEGTLKV